MLYTKLREKPRDKVDLDNPQMIKIDKILSNKKFVRNLIKYRTYIIKHRKVSNRQHRHTNTLIIILNKRKQRQSITNKLPNTINSIYQSLPNAFKINSIVNNEIEANNEQIRNHHRFIIIIRIVC